MQLEESINFFYNLDPSQLKRDEVFDLFQLLRNKLNLGEIQTVEFIDNKWKVNEWVKKGILLGFRIGNVIDVSINNQFRFFDKDILPLKAITINDSIRQVPGGTSVRDGCYIGKNVVIMPPSYINIGSYIDNETMIDSNALVGSCAYIGKKVHISAGAQIGGVLEPIGMLPVIVEDEVIVGGNCGIFEGVIIKKGAVIASGVQLTSSTPVYDVVKKKIYKRNFSNPLTIPENAVVVSGSRTISGGWPEQFGLNIYTLIIIKYRDDKTNSSTQLEESLR